MNLIIPCDCSTRTYMAAFRYALGNHKLAADSASLPADESLEIQVGGAQQLAALRMLKAELDPTNFFDHHLFTGLWTDDMPAAVSTAG